jgi:hypothetical protein
VLPERLIVVELPLQIVPGDGVAVPPTDVAFTVTVATVENAGPQEPFVTFARKYFVPVRAPVVKVELVCPVMSPKLTSSVEDCH